MLRTREGGPSAQDPTTCLPWPLVIVGACRPACWSSSGRPEGKPAAWSKKAPGAFPLGQDPHLEFQLCAKGGVTQFLGKCQSRVNVKVISAVGSSWEGD